MLLAAGAVWSETWVNAKSPAARKSITRTAWISLACGAVSVFTLTIPMAPLHSAWWRVAEGSHGNFSLEIGWPEYVATIARVRDSLPPQERGGARVLAADEGGAGAVNLYGRRYGLGEAISGMNSNWLRGYGHPPPETVIAVEFTRSEVDRIFARCELAAQYSDPLGVSNITIGGRGSIFVCRDIREPWPEFWKHYQYYG